MPSAGALLVGTSKQMPLINRRLAPAAEIPVLIGEAAINRKFGRRILFLKLATSSDLAVYST
ncbi:MAG: hypothetical protein U0521_10350 [Anaerolineae bacterium]